MSFAVHRRFFHVVYSVKLLLMRNDSEAISRVKEPATPDTRILGS